MENTVEKGIIAIVMVLILSVTSCTVISNKQDNDAIQEMVNKGFSPQEAACAVKPASIDRTKCAVISK